MTSETTLNDIAPGGSDFLEEHPVIAEDLTIERAAKVQRCAKRVAALLAEFAHDPVAVSEDLDALDQALDELLGHEQPQGSVYHILDPDIAPETLRELAQAEPEVTAHIPLAILGRLLGAAEPEADQQLKVFIDGVRAKEAPGRTQSNACRWFVVERRGQAPLEVAVMNTTPSQEPKP